MKVRWKVHCMGAICTVANLAQEWMSSLLVRGGWVLPTRAKNLPSTTAPMARDWKIDWAQFPHIQFKFWISKTFGQDWNSNSWLTFKKKHYLCNFSLFWQFSAKVDLEDGSRQVIKLHTIATTSQQQQKLLPGSFLLDKKQEVNHIFWLWGNLLGRFLPKYPCSQFC